MKDKNNNKGFSLIELLVVITIIGVLIGVSFVGFNQARKSARDAKRKADLEQIRSALEIYRNDCKTYPANVQSGSFLTGAEAICTGNVYMSLVPSDPITTQTYYYSRTDSNSYVLCAYLETGSGEVSGCGSCGAIPCNYKVINP